LQDALASYRTDPRYEHIFEMVVIRPRNSKGIIDGTSQEARYQVDQWETCFLRFVLRLDLWLDPHCPIRTGLDLPSSTTLPSLTRSISSLWAWMQSQLARS
jgi:hypothetical protein